MVLAGLTRQLRLQYAMRKDVIILGGIGLFGVSADHLILQRSENKLRSLGLWHQGKLDAAWGKMDFDYNLQR